MAFTVVVTPNLMAPTDPLTPAKVNLAADPAVAVTGNLSAAGDGPTATPTSGQVLQWNATTSHYEPYTPLVKAVRGQSTDLRAWVDETTATTINVRADGVNLEQVTGASPSRSFTGTTMTTLSLGNMTIDCGALAGNGAGKMDAGTLAAATWYYLWIIHNGTSAAGLISLQYAVGSLALPTGYIYAARFGAFRTKDAAAEFIQAYQVGDRVSVRARPLTVFTPSTSLAALSGTQATEFAAAVPIVARGAMGIIGRLDGFAVNVCVASARSDGSAPSGVFAGAQLVQCAGGLAAASTTGGIRAFTGCGNFEVTTPQTSAYERNMAVVAKVADANSCAIDITGYIVS